MALFVSEYREHANDHVRHKYLDPEQRKLGDPTDPREETECGKITTVASFLKS